MEITINKIAEQLKARLKKPLPGNKAHLTTRIKTKSEVTFPNTEETAIPAAVLILLFPFEGDIQFFLTKRTEDVEHHKGQISLPGGIRENNETLEETALRETKEEIGIDPNTIMNLGSLTPFFIPVTGYIVHPFIGWCKEKPLTQVHDVEVNQLFSVSTALLFTDLPLSRRPSRNQLLWAGRSRSRSPLSAIIHTKQYFSPLVLYHNFQRYQVMDVVISS